MPMLCTISMKPSNSGELELSVTMSCSGGGSRSGTGGGSASTSSSTTAAVVTAAGLMSSSAAIDIHKIHSPSQHPCTSIFKKLAAECNLSSSTSIVCLDYSSSFGSITSWGTTNDLGDDEDDSTDEDEDEEDNYYDEGTKKEKELLNTKIDGTKSEEEEDWLCFCSTSPGNYSPNSSQLMEGRLVIGGYTPAPKTLQKVIPGANNNTSVYDEDNPKYEGDTIDGYTVRRSTPNSSKKVHFKEGPLVEVIKFEDDEESQKMREPYWEIFARDRARFNERIIEIGKVLSPVLMNEHRAKMYSRIMEVPSSPC